MAENPFESEEPQEVQIEAQAAGPRRQLVGKPAPDFTLKDERGVTFHLYAALANGPVLLAFYPGDFTPVCTKQLCNYRDSIDEFRALGVQLLGVSHNTVARHAEFARAYQFPFPLLSDPSHNVAKAFGCRSFFLIGGVSRAIAIVNRQHILLYRYVEPTTLTHRKAEELLAIVRDLRDHALI